MSLDWALSTVLGGRAEPVGLTPTQSLSLFRQSVKQADADEARILRDPKVRREFAEFERAVAQARKPEDLLKNPRAFGVLLEGLGLGDQTANAGLARVALLSDPKQKKALVNQLSDSRWKAAAERLDFKRSGMQRLRDPTVMAAVRDGVVQYRRISEISKKSQAVADALYVHDRAETAPASIYGVLGDKVLRRVATTVADVPKELAFQGVEAQARTLGARFDTKQLDTPKGREALIQRYLLKATLNQVAASSGTTALGILA